MSVEPFSGEKRFCDEVRRMRRSTSKRNPAAQTVRGAHRRPNNSKTNVANSCQEQAVVYDLERGCGTTTSERPVPQVWLTYQELGAMFALNPQTARSEVIANGWPRRRCSDAQTRVKL